MTSQATPATPYGLLKPFIWLALLSFLLGFSGFLYAGASSVARAHGRVQAISAPLNPTSPDETASQPI